ncbi:division/cell wall cluster transcriptional repressor MraZ [Pelagibius sp. Alg239-R121]|uniref:division/cell wall cluster transcriptional repressor MraZ n=1 Tax=Pelagibius sp. Alg239-R121 TaxID=2993448 RepID=UPI0024A6168E|nr:division/cell wall cluster transcriptional repressor MraZ [Pelagibius sp. Alg239-R121]
MVFIGTFENKVDRKGRVSVPATFRQTLASQSFNGIIAFRSYRVDAIEACGMDFIEKLNERVSSYDFFSETQDDLATMIFADSLQLPFDSEGRIILPASLIEHAGITERAAFVGKGRQFQIWQPDALEAHKTVARDRARAQGLTVPMGDNGGAAK